MPQDFNQNILSLCEMILGIRSTDDVISLISDLPIFQNTQHRCLLHFPRPIILHNDAWFCVLFIFNGDSFYLFLCIIPHLIQDYLLWNSYLQHHIFPWTYCDDIFSQRPPLFVHLPQNHCMLIQLLFISYLIWWKVKISMLLSLVLLWTRRFWSGSFSMVY